MIKPTTNTQVVYTSANEKSCSRSEDLGQTFDANTLSDSACALSSFGLVFWPCLQNNNLRASFTITVNCPLRLKETYEHHILHFWWFTGCSLWRLVPSLAWWGGFWKLILYLALSWLGFYLGHLVFLHYDVKFMTVGGVQMAGGIVGSLVFLFLGNWFTRINPEG